MQYYQARLSLGEAHTSLPAATAPSQLAGRGSPSQGGIRAGGPRPGGWEQTPAPGTLLARPFLPPLSHLPTTTTKTRKKEVRDSPPPRRAGKENARRRRGRASQSMYSNLKSRRRAAQSAVPIYPAAAATPPFSVFAVGSGYIPAPISSHSPERLPSNSRSHHPLFVVVATTARNSLPTLDVLACNMLGSSQVGNDQVTPQDNCIHKALVLTTWVFGRLQSLDEEPHPPTRTPGKRGRYYFRMSRVIRQAAAGTRSCPVSPLDPCFPRAKISRLVFCAQYALHSYHRPGGGKRNGIASLLSGRMQDMFLGRYHRRQSDKSCMLCLPLTGPTQTSESSRQAMSPSR